MWRAGLCIASPHVWPTQAPRNYHEDKCDHCVLGGDHCAIHGSCYVPLDGFRGAQWPLCAVMCSSCGTSIPSGTSITKLTRSEQGVTSPSPKHDQQITGKRGNTPSRNSLCLCRGSSVVSSVNNVCCGFNSWIVRRITSAWHCHRQPTARRACLCWQ